MNLHVSSTDQMWPTIFFVQLLCPSLSPFGPKLNAPGLKYSTQSHFVNILGPSLNPDLDWETIHVLLSLFTDPDPKSPGPKEKQPQNFETKLRLRVDCHGVPGWIQQTSTHPARRVTRLLPPRSSSAMPCTSPWTTGLWRWYDCCSSTAWNLTRAVACLVNRQPLLTGPSLLHARAHHLQRLLQNHHLRLHRERLIHPTYRPKVVLINHLFVTYKFI